MKNLALSLLIPLSAILPAAEKPNIIVILADDLGYGDPHCYNPERGKIPTPNIDRLAAEGMSFTDAHSSSGVCSPSRYSLLTGRYHWRTSLRFVQNGMVRNEGDIQSPLGGKPYGISCRSIVPKMAECENLLVPWALSASHIAFGSIRMEPVFMALGQSSGTAACMAIDGKTAVQAVPYKDLRSRLTKDDQRLE